MRPALVLGGTGMLAGTAARLASQGHSVLTPSRRGLAPAGCLGVAADWSQPAQLAATVQENLTGPAEVVICWVHHPYRAAALGALSGQIAPSALVVEVWSQVGARSAEQARLRESGPRSHVVLGSRANGQWLSHAEISAAVSSAVERRASRGAGSPTDVLLVGNLQSRSRRDIEFNFG